MIESVYFALVAILLLLAALDLLVGVSNDAVNFLNSAIGTKIAPLFVIMATASLGVLLGSAFSSGMMDVARKGLFHPEMFTFKEVMFIFSAVMIADVLLLNVFNSLGLPTSTTVSIIFELLGAAVFAAFYKLHSEGMNLVEIINYVKTDKTATIVSAIILSVAISFVAGMLVQFVCRIGFSFRFENSVKYLGGLFTGLSLTAICYFLIIKGVKGASFMKEEWLTYIKENTQLILVSMFILFFVIGQIMALAKKNIFRVIVLAGTFALAFSFAGNDLVNFVGAPLAAMDAFIDWSNSGADVNEYMMTSLDSNARVSTFWLVLSGIIMCLTLWTSKKARRVIKTSINLSASTRGQKEQFGATKAGRIITRIGLSIASTLVDITPKPVVKAIANRYKKAPILKGADKMPFDYVRASINLVVASALISVATSLKLPLSTTYVTFMVAMGTSFADGAWNRESAVYRISGVITVISGWFLTGFSAFIAALVVSAALFYAGYLALFSFAPLTLVLLIYSNFIKKDKNDKVIEELKNTNDEKILNYVSKNMVENYELSVHCLHKALSAFYEDNELSIRKALNKATILKESIFEKRSYYYDMSVEEQSNKEETKKSVDAKFFYYQTFTNMYEASSSIHNCLKLTLNHVANRHSIFGGELKVALSDVLKHLEKLTSEVQNLSQSPSINNIDDFIKRGKKLNHSIDKCQVQLVTIISHEKVSVHSSDIFLNYLQAVRDVTNRYISVATQLSALANLVKEESKAPPLLEDSVIKEIEALV